MVLAASAEAAPERGSGARAIAVRAIGSGGYQGLPLVGSRVVVRGDGRVLARGRTGSEGVALLRAPRGLGDGGLRVLVRGGKVSGHRFGGRMVARLGSYSWPRTVYVDSVTTLVARYAAAHPRLSQRRAARRVRQFLRLPGYYEVGLDGRTNVAFDGRRFLRAARHVGYDGLVARLVQAMDERGEHRSFRHVRSRGVGRASISNLPGAGNDVSSVAEALSAGTGFFDVLEKTDYVLDFVDAALSITGVGDDGPSREEIEAIDSKLEQIEQSLAAVREAIGKVEEQAARRSYSSLLREIKPASEAVKEAESILGTAVDLGTQYGCGTKDPNATECALIEGMMSGKGGFAEELREGTLGSPGGLNTYGGRIAGEAVPRGVAEEEGVVQAGSGMITARAGTYLSPEDSQRVRAIATYWAANFAEAVGLAPIAWALGGDNELTLEHAISQIQPTAQVMAGLIPQAVPQGTVLDIQHGLMWPTEISGEGGAQLYGQHAAAGPWRYSAASGRWAAASGETIGAIAVGGAEALPYENWNVAGAVRVATLLGTVSGGGEALLDATGIEQAIVTPAYQGSERGVEGSWQTTASRANSGCGSIGSSSCFWPVWVDDGTVGNLNGNGSAAYNEGAYEENEMTEVPLPPVYWWGLRYGTLYGNDPVAKIPFLFFREVQPGNCYFYPNASAPEVGSPGCPGK